MGTMLGSMVQKGKFFASAIDFCAIAFMRVDLPTLGRPTSPTMIFIAHSGGRILVRGRAQACDAHRLYGMNADTGIPFDDKAATTMHALIIFMSDCMNDVLATLLSYRINAMPLEWWDDGTLY